MPRRARIVIAGVPVHVIQRGNSVSSTMPTMRATSRGASSVILGDAHGQRGDGWLPNTDTYAVVTERIWKKGGPL